MKLIINDEIHETSEDATISELLEQLNLTGKFVAVERNREVVSYKRFSETVLTDGDILEIVTLVGGG